MAPLSYGSVGSAPPGAVWAAQERSAPAGSGSRRRTWLAATGVMVAAVGVAGCVLLARTRATALMGALGDDAGQSSRLEGGVLPGSVGSGKMMSREFMVGAPGWEPGPDYYSTENWDNAELHPSLFTKHFDPYLGPKACPTCESTTTTFEMSSDPRCDGSPQCMHIRNILHLKEWWNGAAFNSVKYQDGHWVGAQVAHFMTANVKSIILVPPCFFPRLARAELRALNAAVYEAGMSIMLVGGLQGANFLSQNLQGNDGYGFVDGAGSDPNIGSEQFTIDTVFSDGPFYMQNAATTTEFQYGSTLLEGLPSTIGIPARSLPPNTVHYYMSPDEISVVFEIPSGAGRILFIGYDYADMAPHWIDTLLLAQRELQLESQDLALPPSPALRQRRPPSTGPDGGQSLAAARAGGGVGGGDPVPQWLKRKEEALARRGVQPPAPSADGGGRHFDPAPHAVSAAAAGLGSGSTGGRPPAVHKAAKPAAAPGGGGGGGGGTKGEARAGGGAERGLSHDEEVERQIRKAMAALAKQRCPPGNNFSQCGPEKREYGPGGADTPTFKAARPTEQQLRALAGRGQGGERGGWSAGRIRSELRGLSLHDFDLTGRSAWEHGGR